MAKPLDRATFGFSAHTGWAALVAVAGPETAPRIVDRRRIEMIGGRDPPRFVYHAAMKLPLAAAELFVQKAVELARTNAVAALRAAVAHAETQHAEIVATGIIVGGKPLVANLSTILESHALIHTAEGVLFRAAIRNASERLKIPVVEIRARDLPARAARVLAVPETKLPERLETFGRSAGRPWAKDQKEAFLVALVAAAGA